MRALRLAGLLLCIASVSSAWAVMPKADIKGGKDHPLLSRFEGAKMVAYDVKQFDEAPIPVSKRVYRREQQDRHFDKMLNLEGKVTRIAYLVSRDRSSLEVLRNYENALQKAGLKTVFSCTGKDCGDNFDDFWMSRRLGRDFLISSEADSAFRWGSREARYLVAAGTRPDGSPVHVAVYVMTPRENYEGGVYLEIVEGKPMETGKVAANLNAAEMAKGIVNEGRVAVYGVYFDTGKAEVKPDSKPALAEMAKMLQQDPKMKVFVVGHTDNQGVPAQNLALSQQRADAVVKALARDYKIDAKRLSAKGVAAYAPLASNRQEDGRRKNRRVELVEQ